MRPASEITDQLLTSSIFGSCDEQFLLFAFKMCRINALLLFNGDKQFAALIMLIITPPPKQISSS